MAFLFTREAGGAELRIRFQGPNHEPIPIKKAELLLVNWGFTDVIELPAEGDLLRLTLDPAWMKSRQPEWWPRFGVSIYVQADGYAGIRSEEFAWLGAGAPENANAEAKIDFRQGNPVVVRAGDEREMLVTLRRPIPRRIRFLDEERKPVRDIKVSAGMFWSNENHCRRLAGFDPLITETQPDAQGAVRVPDGDFQYAITVYGQHLAIKGEDTSGEGYLITSLTSSETVVQIHRFQRQPLSILVLAGGEPLRGAPLWADRPSCGGPAARAMVSSGRRTKMGESGKRTSTPRRPKVFASSTRAGNRSGDWILRIWKPAPSRSGWRLGRSWRGKMATALGEAQRAQRRNQAKSRSLATLGITESQ